MKMPHFMVICHDGKDEPAVKFFENMDEADAYICDATCGVGLKAQCYEWNSENGWYEFLFE